MGSVDEFVARKLRNAESRLNNAKDHEDVAIAVGQIIEAIERQQQLISDRFSENLSAQESVIKAMNSLTDHERLGVLRRYCHSCGRVGGTCDCWRIGG